MSILLYFPINYSSNLNESAPSGQTGADLEYYICSFGGAGMPWIEFRSNDVLFDVCS